MSKTTTTRTNSVYSIPTQNGDRSFIPDGSISNSKYQDSSISEAKLKSDANAMPFLKTGFQNFVDESSKLTATTTTGTPATGRFYSTITGRASIPDLTQDLKPRMGIERIMTQNIYLLQNEFGPSGEPVYGALNDDKGLIRFVGSGWGGTVNTAGQFVNSAIVGDYIEITFYGTGLNVLSYAFADTRNLQAAINGGSLGSNILVGSTSSSILNGRGYSTNQVYSAIPTQSLGIYTIKIQITAGAPLIYGFEILNESSSIKTNPGIAYINGKKVTTAAQDSTSYNTGVTGTKGGRMLVYQDSDGVIRRSFQAVATSPSYLTSADHSNEEVVRTYHWREFGAGRGGSDAAGDDFSFLAGTTRDRAFTLDDGTTTLVASQVQNNSEYLHLQNNGSFWTLTFVGTGIDLVMKDSASGGTDNYTYSIDGASASTFSTSGNTALRVVKVASGLPYGTHTLKLTRVTASTYVVQINQFIVYQPKKPTLPAGAIELADYNVMADYSANTTAGVDTIATGVLRKFNIRELVYVNGTGGTTDWAVSAIGPTTYAGGWENATNRGSAYVEYTFYGIGFEYRDSADTSRSSNISVTLNGLSATTLNFSTLVSSVYGGASFSSGTMSFNASLTRGAGVSVRGLPLAKYTVRFTNNTAGSIIALNNIDFITPIHSIKSNLYADLQNTLSVGSNGVCDNRKITPVNSNLSTKKNWAQAIGITSGPTTTSSSYVPCPDLSTTIKTNGGDLEIKAHLSATQNTAGNGVGLVIFVDGQSVGVDSTFNTNSSTINVTSDLSISVIVPVSAGIHKIDAYWRAIAGGTATGDGNKRILLVREI